jgi:hypothetical protein
MVIVVVAVVVAHDERLDLKHADLKRARPAGR